MIYDSISADLSYSKPLGFFYSFPSGMNATPESSASAVYPMEESWDFLIVLDACRYDYMEKVYHDYFPQAKLTKRFSPGTWTLEWARRVFTDYYPDCIYVSANPFIGYSKKVGFNGIRIRFEASQHFEKIIEVWKMGWDEKLGTVHPDRVTQATIQAIAEFPENRFIVHYLQPHFPFISLARDFPTIRFQKLYWGIRSGVPIIFGKKVGNKMVSLLVPNGEEKTIRKLGKRKYSEAYEDNLRTAMASVRQLVRHLKGRIVITSDHGELLGENGLVGHPSLAIATNQQLEIPWLEIEQDSRILSAASLQSESRAYSQDDETIIKKRLRALGYE